MRALLSEKRAKRAIAVVPVPWPADGALASAGLKAADLDAEIGIYVLESGAAAELAGKALQGRIGAAETTVSGTNGALLLVGRLASGGPDEASALRRIASAFAGNE